MDRYLYRPAGPAGTGVGILMYDSIVDGERARADLEELCSYRTNPQRADHVRERFGVLGLETVTEDLEGHRGVYDRNVIATYEGDPGSDRYVMVCAHHDKVYGSPGANDNASGTVGLMELADAFVQRNDKVNVVFASFAAEEFMLEGSSLYMAGLSDEERARYVGAINLDCIGAGDELVVTSRTMGKQHDNDINTAILETADELGISCVEKDFKRGFSDHLSLLKGGIPATYIARMDRPGWGNLLQRWLDGHTLPNNIHTKGDRPEGIDDKELAEAIDVTYYALKDIYDIAANDAR